VSGADPDGERRRLIRRNAALLALTAFAIYAAFIVSGVMKAQP